MSLHGNLYKLARIANNTDAILHPKRIPNRVKEHHHRPRTRTVRHLAVATLKTKPIFGTTQTILTPDGLIHHTAPFRWFPHVQRWINLRAAGPGTRNIRDTELDRLRGIAQHDRT